MVRGIKNYNYISLSVLYSLTIIERKIQSLVNGLQRLLGMTSRAHQPSLMDKSDHSIGWHPTFLYSLCKFSKSVQKILHTRASLQYYFYYVPNR